MRVFRSLLVVAVGAGFSRALIAQSLPGDVVGYASLDHTPIGLLAPIAPRSQLGFVQRGVAFALRYGSIGEGPANNMTHTYAATALLPAGRRSIVSFTAGSFKETCPDPECKSILMLGAGAQYDLRPNLFSARGTAPRIAVGITGDVGYGARQFETTYLTAAAALPITVVFGGARAGVRAAPWLTPGFGFGRASIKGNIPFDKAQTGSRPMISGGLAFYNPASSWSVQAGGTHVVRTDSKTLLGVNLVLNW